MIKTLYADHLLEDDREPILSFQMAGYQADLYPFKIAFYAQSTVVLLMQFLATCGMAVVTYYGVVRQRKTSATAAYLVAYGIVIPFALWLPIPMMEVLDIRSLVLRLSLMCTPMNAPFRCLEALYGFCPTTATTSLWSFVRHMGFNLVPDYRNGDFQPLRATTWFYMLVRFLFWVSVSSALCSFMVPYDFAPFSVSRDPTETFVAMELGQWLNTYLVAVVCSQSLVYGMYGAALMAGPLCGILFDAHVSDFPLFFATSPSEFWGRRWNTLIHYALKQGVYKPVRAAFDSQSVATLFTFLVSGAIHEYVWFVLFYQNRHQREEKEPNVAGTYEHRIGKQLLFFGWNGVLLFLEYLVANRMSYWKRRLPRPIVTAFVILLALPVGHFFTADLVASGFFRCKQIAFPRLHIQRI